MSGQWQDKSELEQIIFSSIKGTPELRKHEKLHYLGHFRERMLEAISSKQLKTDKGQRLVRKALEDPRAYELLIYSRVRTEAMSLVRHAQKHKVDFTVVNNPDFKGPVVVAVAAKTAIEIKRLHVDDEVHAD